MTAIINPNTLTEQQRKEIKEIYNVALDSFKHYHEVVLNARDNVVELIAARLRDGHAERMVLLDVLFGKDFFEKGGYDA